MTNWTLRPTQRFEQSLQKLAKKDRESARRIVSKLEELRELEDPRGRCKALQGPLKGLWRLRVGDWRVMLDIHAGQLVIIALDVGHRSQIYLD